MLPPGMPPQNGDVADGFDADLARFDDLQAD